MSKVEVKTQPRLAVYVDAAAGPSRRSATTSHAPRVKIDASAFPHLMDTIVEAADADLLRTFRVVSRRFRNCVDRLIATHLILDGLTTPANPWLPGALLHNGEAGARRHVLFRDSDKTPRTVLGVPSFPRRSELDHTRVLDVRGTLRYEVLDALPPLPKLDTLRMYEYYNAAPGSTEAGKTLFWGATQRAPSLPRARRLVVFSSLELCPHGKFKPQLPRHYPPGIEELVIHLALPCGRDSGDWAPLDLPSSPPASLARVMVILAPSPCSSPACGAVSTYTEAVPIGTTSSRNLNAGLSAESGPPVRADSEVDEDEVTRAHELGTGTLVDPAHRPDEDSVRGMVTDLVGVLERLGVPATVVGGECVGRRLLHEGVLSPLKKKVGAELRSAREVRTELGEREWSTLTREAQRL